jgi:DNA polymerase III epsilon subunit-like protein
VTTYSLRDIVVLDVETTGTKALFIRILELLGKAFPTRPIGPT